MTVKHMSRSDRLSARALGICFFATSCLAGLSAQPAGVIASVTPAAGVATTAAQAGETPLATATASQPLPMMIDLGANACKACKEMKPILEKAERDYQGRAVVKFIDVWANRDESAKYGIRTIPTQIFYDASGKEVWRHEGFLDAQAIDAKFTELGVASATR